VSPFFSAAHPELFQCGALPTAASPHVWDWPACLPHMASLRQSAAAPGFSRRRAQFRTGICRDGSIARQGPQWTAFLAPARHRGHDRRSHRVQCQRSQTLCFTRLRRHAKSRSFVGRPAVALPRPTKSLKGITAKRANEIVGWTGGPFWQEESYDHRVRNQRNSIKGARRAGEGSRRVSMV